MFKFIAGFCAGVMAMRSCPVFRDEEKVRNILRVVKKKVKTIIQDDD